MCAQHEVADPALQLLGRLGRSPVEVLLPVDLDDRVVVVRRRLSHEQLVEPDLVAGQVARCDWFAVLEHDHALLPDGLGQRIPYLLLARLVPALRLFDEHAYVGSPELVFIAELVDHRHDVGDPGRSGEQTLLDGCFVVDQPDVVVDGHRPRGVPVAVGPDLAASVGGIAHVLDDPRAIDHAVLDALDDWSRIGEQVGRVIGPEGREHFGGSDAVSLLGPSLAAQPVGPERLVGGPDLLVGDEGRPHLVRPSLALGQGALLGDAIPDGPLDVGGETPRG